MKKCVQFQLPVKSVAANKHAFFLRLIYIHIYIHSHEEQFLQFLVCWTMTLISIQGKGAKHSLLIQSIICTYMCSNNFHLMHWPTHQSRVCIIATSRARKFKSPLPRSTVLPVTHRWSRAHCPHFPFVLISDHFYRCPRLSRMYAKVSEADPVLSTRF